MNDAKNNGPILRGACPVSGSLEIKPLCEVNGYQVWRCPESRTDFVWPMPDDQTLARFYDESYFEGGEQGGYSNYDIETENVIPIFQDVLDEFERDSPGQSILDIGCAYGTHLAIAANRGWKCFGVELSEHARRIAKLRHANSISVVDRMENLEPRVFDLIVMLDVIEHLRDPYQFFFALFSQGAIGSQTNIVITTPNARSHDAVSNPGDWVYRHPPSHLVYYSAESLQLLMQRLGFSVTRVEGIYPFAMSESGKASYEDEYSSRNLELVKYAGLICKAQGSGLSEVMRGTSFPTAASLKIADAFAREQTALVEKQRVIETMHEKFARLCNVLAEKETLLRENHRAIEVTEEASALLQRNIDVLKDDLAKANRVLAQHQQELQVVKEELAGRNQEIAHLKQSRLYRLGNTLAHEPMSSRKLTKIIYLVGAMTTPALVRRRILPVIGALRERFLSAPPPLPSSPPYQVRQLHPQRERRPRVLHAIANFMTGGSSRLVVDLIEHLGHLYEQEILTSHNPIPPAYAGVTIHQYPQPISPDPLLEYLNRFGPDLIHVHYWGDCDEPWYSQVFSAARSYGCKVIENINTPVEPYFSESIEQYIYVSDYVRDTFGRGEGNGRTIYPGSDFATFARQNPHDMPDNTIGMVYRLENDKLNEQSINVFIKVAKDRPQTKILIVGGGKFLEYYKEVAYSNEVMNAFEFTGYVSYEDLPALYQRMSIFVAPVWKESFGQVSAFAMNMGMPVVGYDIGALGEIVGDKALLAPPGDSDRLARIIIDLLDDREKRLSIGMSNRERAQSMFTVEAMIDSYAKLYGELVGELR